MHGKLLSLEKRENADWLLREICIADGMSKIRADWIYLSVDLFDKSSARPDLQQVP